MHSCRLAEKDRPLINNESCKCDEKMSRIRRRAHRAQCAPGNPMHALLLWTCERPRDRSVDLEGPGIGEPAVPSPICRVRLAARLSDRRGQVDFIRPDDDGDILSQHGSEGLEIEAPSLFAGSVSGSADTQPFRSTHRSRT